MQGQYYEHQLELMVHPLEDLIEMSNLTSPKKKPARLKKFKRHNQVHSPPFLSPTRSPTSDNRDITSVFSVKKPATKYDEDDTTETISELSDDVLSQENYSPGKSLRLNEKLNKFKKSLEKIRNESGQIDEKIKSVRSKFQLEENKHETRDFLFMNSNFDDPEKENIDFLVQYMPAQHLKFNINLAEKDNLSFFNRHNFIQERSIKNVFNPVTLQTFKPNSVENYGKLTTYLPPKPPIVQMQEVVVIKNNILEFSVSQLKFFHHPLFSLEHVLQEKLRQLFEKYSNEFQLLEDWKNARDEGVKGIRKLRENLFREGKMQRERLKNILNVWKAVKKLRSTQKASNTTIRLIIKKDLTNLQEETESYNSLFKEMMKDIMNEHKATYKRKMKEYNEKLKSKSEESENSETSEMGKPTFDVDKGKIESELRRKFQESFRPPGEPKVILYLNYDQEITNAPNDQENDRRKVASTTKFTLKILCNNIPVCKSRSVSLDENFSLDINEMFSVQLTDVPRFLDLEVYEHPKGLLKKKIADLRIEIPITTALYTNAEFAETRFERREIVHYKHSGVGSGYSLTKIIEDNNVDFDIKELDLSNRELYTKGLLDYKIGWQGCELKNTQTRSDNVSLIREMSEIINKWGSVDEERLEHWLEGKSLNLNDLSKVGLIEFLDSINIREIREWKKENKYFRLSPYADELEFCKIEDIQKNIRFQYLKLRDQKELEFDGTLIPNRIREINFGLLNDLKKRKALEAIQDDEFEEDPDSLRDTGRRRLKQIYTKIFNKCKSLDNNLSYESVVDEKYLIHFEDVVKTSLKNIFNWFRWQPKLTTPLPKLTKNRKREDKKEIMPKPQNKIIIKVLGGKNVPQRRIHDSVREDEVKPYLELSYEDFSSKTIVATGSDPVWNSLVELPLEYHHTDYLNPNALSGSISVNLFDCIQETAPENEILEKNWLGEVKIPVAELSTGINLSGWFLIKKPPMLFGYQTFEEKQISSTKSPKQHKTSSDETYIHMDLCVSPSMPTLEPNMIDLQTNDVAYIKDHVLKWMDVFNSNFPSRKISAVAIDTNGRMNCITRFLRPLEPPQLNNEEFDMTAEQCLRYVSLIPFTEGNHFYQHIWLTSHQFLNLMIGSIVDHCVTLTCFLLALKLDVYLLFGYGLPRGSTCYVLMSEYTRDSDIPNYSILDVVYNEKINLTDPYCPLQRIYCVVNGENVWGNVQRTQNSAFLRFDLTRKSDWWPLFDNNISAPTNFVNNNISFASDRDFEDVERQLDRKLKRKFARWRPMQRTIFNHRISDTFKSILNHFEMNAMFGKSNTEATLEVNKATAQYNINGLILNFPYTSLTNILKKIKELNIHVQSQEITEFALSILIHCYPGQVLSVWIFIGAIHNKFDF
ncbi:unnamed protein product [Ceutorhynchus assimilis]|uniref:C2 domain-containing protein n=1 Tax=Ceutorhynchus assimilis TaxID=467358 RepID=A0A9P0GMC8_9CUCU|nr:unnamed protein product [Ceutorhynchus assimilis]